MLWLPYQAYTLLIRPRGPSQLHADSPLGDAALLLLLALIFHAPPADAPFGNPYRQSLQKLQDADDRGGWTGFIGEGGCLSFSCWLSLLRRLWHTDDRVGALDWLH